jgi:hypothetical protein
LVKIATKFCKPTNDGGAMIWYSVKLKTKDATIGPSVQIKNPTSHGAMKR